MTIRKALVSVAAAAGFCLAAGPARAFMNGSAAAIVFADGSQIQQYSQSISTVTGDIEIMPVDSSYQQDFSPSVTINVTFQAYDGFGNNITTSTLISFDGFATSQVLTSTAAVVSIAPTIPISAPFRIAPPAGTVGTVYLYGFTSDLSGGTYSYETLSVLGNVSFSGVSVRNDPSASPGTTTTITPDHDGFQDSAIIDGSIPGGPGGSSWQVVIYSTSSGPSNPVAVYYANTFSPEVTWYGYDSNSNAVVPNGIYNVRLQTFGGAIVDDTLRVVVNTAFISGTVANGLTTQINVYGSGAGGFAQTNSDFPNFTVWGLKPGQLYGVQVSANGYITQNINNVPANSSVPLVTLAQAGVLHVGATRSLGLAGTNPEIWASLSANTTDYTTNVYGTVHFPAETAASDNGDWNPVTRTTFTALNVPPGQPINLQLSVYQYGNYRHTGIIIPVAGQILDDLFTSTEIVKNPTVSGTITLPAPAPAVNGGASVSVQGYLGAQTQPSAFGGIFIPSGQTTGAYQIFGVTAGTWTFRTYAQGLVSSSASVTVGTLDVPNVNFALSQGGVISGNIVLEGNNSTAPAPQGFNPCALGQIPVSLNAFSPTSFGGAWTQVCVTTGTTQVSVPYSLTGLDDGTYEIYPFLPGFQLDPPGRLVVTVSSPTHAASQDIDYLRLSGTLQISAVLPGVDVSTQVSYSVNLTNGGPDNFQQQGFLLPGSSVTINGMGTGIYQVVLQDQNPGKGLIKQSAAAVVNGAPSALAMDMTDPTFTATGLVDLSGSLALPAPWSVSVSSTAGLAAAAAAQGSTAPVVQVFSFPLPQNFNGNVQPYTQVQAFPVAGQTYATFTVTGLPVGSYLFRVQNDLNPPPPCPAPNCGQPGFPEFGTSSQLVLTTGNVSGVSLKLSNGADVTGTMTTSVTDDQTRVFDLSLVRDDNLVVFQSTAGVVNGSGSFLFQHVSDGNYSLQVREETSPSGTPTPNFVAAPVRVVVAAGAPVSASVTLLQAGSIVGTLRDADSNVLITNLNAAQYLPDNFFFYAQANPSIPGGHAEMERCSGQPGCNGNIFISSTTGQFAIYRVMPGQSYDVFFSGFQDSSGSAASKGQKTYVPFALSGLRVGAGQTVDLGLIDLRQGVTLSGQVTLAGSTTTLANVSIEAFPSQADGQNRGNLSVQAFTDQNGNFTLRGIDRNRRFYDVVAAPRPGNGDISSLLSGIKYGQETQRNVDVPAVIAASTGVYFSLTPANGQLSGSVVTADGGALQQPFGDGGVSQNGASINLHLVGATNTSDDPLGEIQETTDVQGNFTIKGLKPGTYVMRSIALGYVTDLRNVVVAAGANNVGSPISLRKGAALSGALKKPDGSAPSSSDVKFLVGVDQNFTEFVFGPVDTDSSGNITGYHMDGFKTGLSYSIVAANDGSDIVSLASGVTFTGSTQTQTLDLVFKPSPPAVFVNQSRSGNSYDLRFFSTHKLRNLTPADNDLTQIVTCPTCGAGTGSINFSSSSISPSRDTIEVFYDGVPNESSFQLALAFTSAKVDPESPSGSNFVYNSTFTVFAGVGASRIVNIPNALGGQCTLEGTSAGGEFPSGTFNSAGSTAPLTNVQVGVRSTTSTVTLSSFSSPSARAAARLDGARRLGGSAYPTAELFKAITAAPDVSQQVFSNFYDIFLPAGVSHTLKKDALITLKYDDSVTDPSKLNVYYFDPGNSVYLLESGSRQIDTVNHTITVGVRHLSTFVVLSGNAPVVGDTGYTGNEILLSNFPNPFNLKTKTVTLAKPGTSASAQTIEGTMIRYALPPGKSGTVRVDIYDVAGALVRTITEDAPTGGTYYYTTWDGRNNGGKKVASGVYLARFTLNNGDEKFFKMAVIK